MDEVDVSTPYVPLTQILTVRGYSWVYGLELQPGTSPGVYSSGNSVSVANHVLVPCITFASNNTINMLTRFHSFDLIAQKRRVYKVETVGDCYVAVCGLPEPRKDHAIVMSRFARDCLTQMQVLTKKLETSLGPDTGDLSLRIGLHR